MHGVIANGASILCPDLEPGPLGYLTPSRSWSREVSPDPELVWEWRTIFPNFMDLESELDFVPEPEPESASPGILQGAGVGTGDGSLSWSRSRPRFYRLSIPAHNATLGRRRWRPAGCHNATVSVLSMLLGLSMAM